MGCLGEEEKGMEKEGSRGSETEQTLENRGIKGCKGLVACTELAGQYAGPSMPCTPSAQSVLPSD